MNTPLMEARPPQAALDDVSRFSPGQLIAAIRKHWIVAVVITLAISLGVAFYTLGQKKIYQAEATLLFDPQPPRPLGSQVQAVVDVGGEYWNNKEYNKTQYWVIQSQRLAVQVVKDLALHTNRAFIENAPAGASVSARGREVSPDDAAKMLRSRLTVEPIRDSRLASVKYRDADPARAQRIVTRLVETYAQTNLDDALSVMNNAADWLNNQVGTLKKELEDSEMALHSYKSDKNILSVSLDDQSNMLLGEMQQLRAALTTVETRRNQINARRTELLKVAVDDPANIPSTELLTSPLLHQLRSAYLTARSERDVLLASGKGPSHPDVLAVDAKLNAARDSLLAEVRGVQAAVTLDYNAASAELAGVAGLFGSAKQRALELNLLEIEYNRLRRSKDENEKLYGIVMERSKENDLTRMLRINNIRVVDRAQMPRQPVSPNVPLNVMGGLAVGLVLGLVAAVGREQLDRSIKTPDDVERELGLTFLGLLPSMENSGHRKSDSGSKRRRRQADSKLQFGVPELVVHEHPTSGVAEAARALRTNILFMSPDKPFKTLLVTSAAPSEGKTTVASCIAVAMAQAGRRVVLLDCDMRRPRIHRIFRCGNEVGVTTALIDIEGIGSMIRDTEVPNLSVMTTGPLPPNPAEILHSDAFGKLLSTLGERFDNVVIDSPPVAPVTDAAILSTRADATILVVRAFQTTKELARRAVRSLRDVGNRRVATVLNAVDFERREYGYYQYYYYRREGYSAAPTSGAGADEAAPPPS